MVQPNAEDHVSVAASQAQQCRQVVGSVKQCMQNELRITSEPTAIKIPRSPDASTIKQNTTAAGERSMFTELCNCSEIHSKAFTVRSHAPNVCRANDRAIHGSVWPVLT